MEQEEKFYQLVAETFAADRSELKDEATPEDIGNWSSITHMELMAKFEQEFGASLDADEITEMDSIGKMKEVLKRHGVKI